MKAGQWTTEQIVTLLQEATKGEQPITALCREKGISEATFYVWRKKCVAQKVRRHEHQRSAASQRAGKGECPCPEGTRKKLLAESQLEIDCLKEINAKNW